MVGETPEKAPWDQRLAESLAQEAWEAANNPDGRRQSPPLREQIKSPYFWVMSIGSGASVSILFAARHGWEYGLGGGIYLCVLLASVRERRASRTARLPRMSTKENP